MKASVLRTAALEIISVWILNGNDQEFVLKCIKYLSFNTSTCQLQPDHDFLIKSTLCKSFKKNVLALTYF